MTLHAGERRHVVVSTEVEQADQQQADQTEEEQPRETSDTNSPPLRHVFPWAVTPTARHDLSNKDSPASQEDHGQDVEPADCNG